MYLNPPRVRHIDGISSQYDFPNKHTSPRMSRNRGRIRTSSHPVVRFCPDGFRQAPPFASVSLGFRKQGGVGSRLHWISRYAKILGMLAECANSHKRTPMEQDHAMKRWVCRVCQETLTPEQILEQVPESMRPQIDPILNTVQGLLDFEIMGVLKPNRKIIIEYPRKSDG